MRALLITMTIIFLSSCTPTNSTDSALSMGNHFYRIGVIQETANGADHTLGYSTAHLTARGKCAELFENLAGHNLLSQLKQKPSTTLDWDTYSAIEIRTSDGENPTEIFGHVDKNYQDGIGSCIRWENNPKYSSRNYGMYMSNQVAQGIRKPILKAMLIQYVEK